MTGSPIFKIKSELNNNKNGEKIRRKLNLSLVQPGAEVVVANERKQFREEMFCGAESAVTATATKTNCGKSIRSSVSSFVFADKKNVKRRLDFDATDNGSDEVSSLRFSGKNVSTFYGFESKHSSVLDGRSLPENVSSTMSPNKNWQQWRRQRRRYQHFSGSYSRSSMTGGGGGGGSSVVSCRRKLFSESEELTQRKKSKLSSPVICEKKGGGGGGGADAAANSRRKEIKLSLQKRFPGVPNSDSARSGLLLNLAFSKYNLPANTKESNLSVNFINNDTVSTVVKKDMAQYSQLKQVDGTSQPHSPVFAAIKKVRRRLNLEERNSWCGGEGTEITTSTLFDNQHEHTDDCNKDKTAITNILVNSGNNNKVDVVDSENESCGKSSHDNSRLNVKKDQVNSNTHFDSNNTTMQPSSPCGGGGGGGGVFFSKKAADRHPIRCKDIGAGIDGGGGGGGGGKEEFFKNSKLRSILKNKILKLARTEDSVYEDSLLVEDEEDGVEVHANESPAAAPAASSSRNRSSTTTAKIICGDNGIRNKFANKNAEKEDVCGGDKQRKKKKKKKKSAGAANNWLKENSFHTDSFVDVRPLRRRQSTLNSSKFFIRSHMERFLKDCLVVAAEQPSTKIIDDDDYDNGNDNKKKQDSSKIEVADERRRRYIIENEMCESVLRAEYVIENVISQEEEEEEEEGKKCKNIEKVSIESIPSQALNEQTIEKTENANSTTLKCGVSYSCVRFSATRDTQNLSSMKSDLNSHEKVYDDDDTTQKFRKKRKHNPDNLISRLDKLCNREKSTSRMWQYEISKKHQIFEEDNTLRTPSAAAAVFSIEKMWKEYSHLILLCSSYQEQVFEHSSADNSVYESGEITSFGIDVCNSVVIILEREYCPNNLTYSSVFQLFPPWNILRFSKRDPIIILKPTKMVIMLGHEKPQTYRDPTLPPNIPSLLNKGKIFCQCLAAATACNCILPNGYSTLMKPLFSSDLNVFNVKNYTREKQYSLENFNSSIADTLIKYKLHAVQRMPICLDLQILHLYENDDWTPNEQLRFLHIISLNESNETCCILFQGGGKPEPSIANNINEEVTFTFSGLIPWKLIPIKNMPLFIQYINFTNVPNELSGKINSNPMMVFVLSKEFGSIMRRTV